jgi:hypothetical protein
VQGLLIGGFGASGSVVIQNAINGRIIFTSDTSLTSATGNLTNGGQIFVETTTSFNVQVDNTGLLNVTGIALFSLGLVNSGTLYVVPRANGTGSWSSTVLSYSLTGEFDGTNGSL